jgi:ribosomal protein S18 acetylase RimI-like enzyme
VIDETRDRALLERLLRDPALGGPTWAGYALADLDDAVFPRTRWLLRDDERALLLVFRWGEGGATAMTFGAFDADLLRAARLPARFDLHAREDHAPEVSALVSGDLPEYVRLGLLRDDLRPVATPAALRLTRLGPGDVGHARALYEHYPGNVFDPARVTAGPYLGAWAGGRLVAIAGTHVASARTRAAALGDVVTHPELRGQGVGAWVTASLCALLFERADHVVLNVQRTNVAALRAYERVGFGARPELRAPYREGAGVSLSRPGW